MLLDIVNVKLLSVWILLSFFEECWDGSWGGQVVELLIDTLNTFKSFESSGAFFRVSLKQWFYISFPGTSDGKESACNAGDLSSIPGLGRSPGEGNDNPLQYSCLEKSMDRGAWWAIAHGHSIGIKPQSSGSISDTVFPQSPPPRILELSENIFSCCNQEDARVI